MQLYKTRTFTSHSSSRIQSTAERLSPGSGADVGVAVLTPHSVPLGQLVEILSCVLADETCL